MRTRYAPVAYGGLLLANGVYLLNPKLPSVIAREGAGIVEAVGPGVTSVKRHASDIDENRQQPSKRR